MFVPCISSPALRGAEKSPQKQNPVEEAAESRRSPPRPCSRGADCRSAWAAVLFGRVGTGVCERTHRDINNSCCALVF